MKQDFGDYVRSLEPTGEPSDTALDKLWTELRRRLRRALQRRGLWDRPPAYLGVTGYSAWSTPETADRHGLPSTGYDALDELAADFYGSMFVERLASLRRYLRSGDAIERVVLRGISQFLYERQRHSDPLGHRLFQSLRAALERAVATGRLQILVGGSKITNDTVFGFDSDVADDSATEERLAVVVRKWNDELLVDWLAARGAEANAMISKLENRLLRLPESEIEAFRFKSLVDAFKFDVRGRLADMWQLSGAEVESSRGHRLHQLVEEGRLRELSDCVEQGVLRSRDQQRTKDKLVRLWRFLEAFAREAHDPDSALSSDETLTAALQRQTLPSNRELSRLLEIRHDRIPELLARLRDEVGHCVESLRGTAGAGSLGGAEGSERPEAKAVMPRDLRQRLKQRTAEAFLRDGATPPSRSDPCPGDLYHFEVGAVPGIEWLLLDLGAGGSEGLLVPADTESWIGSSDLALGETELGPLVLRCDHRLWLPHQSFAADRRSATIGNRRLERARAFCREAFRDGSAAAKDVDYDSDYKDWCRSLDTARLALVREYGGRLAAPLRPEQELDEVRPFRRARGGNPGWRFLALAASLGAVATSAFFAGRLIEERQVRPQIADLENERNRLADERDAISQKLESAQSRFEEEREQIREQHQEEKTTLADRFRQQLDRIAAPEIAVPWLYAIGPQRSDPTLLLVPADARSVLFSVYAEEGDRIEVRRLGGASVWSGEVGPVLTRDEVLVRLPDDLTPPGEYELIVWRGEEPETRAPFRIERP